MAMSPSADAASRYLYSAFSKSSQIKLDACVFNEDDLVSSGPANFKEDVRRDMTWRARLK